MVEEQEHIWAHIFSSLATLRTTGMEVSNTHYMMPIAYHNNKLFFSATYTVIKSVTFLSLSLRGPPQLQVKINLDPTLYMSTQL